MKRVIEHGNREYSGSFTIELDFDEMEDEEKVAFATLVGGSLWSDGEREWIGPKVTISER